MLAVIGAIFIVIGIIGMILNTPRAFKEVIQTGIPVSYSIFITVLITFFWMVDFYGSGFSLKLTVGYIGILSFFWTLSYKYIKKQLTRPHRLPHRL